MKQQRPRIIGRYAAKNHKRPFLEQMESMFPRSSFEPYHPESGQQVGRPADWPDYRQVRYLGLEKTGYRPWPTFTCNDRVLAA